MSVPVAQLLKPYPEYTTVSLYRNNVGTTRYHALEASVQRVIKGSSRVWGEVPMLPHESFNPDQVRGW